MSEKRIFYRSWSELEAAIEIGRVRGNLFNEWRDGHKDYIEVNNNDAWLTTNGNEYIPGAGFKQITWHAESYFYNAQQYQIFPNDQRFDLRFHFNPNMLQYPRTQHLQIYTWWKHEHDLFKGMVKNKKPQFTFGMVLGKKPDKQPNFPPCYFGYIRSEIVKASKNRSFKYYGYGWSKEDPNYGGEAYIKGRANDPQKFHDARILMTPAKFVWATENTHDEYYSMNYLTEKMWHGFLSASVPIYGGAWNVEKLIDPSLFIDIRKFDYDLNKVMDYCENMPETEYQGYLSRIGDFLEKEGQSFTGEYRFAELDKKIHDFVSL